MLSSSFGVGLIYLSQREEKMLEASKKPFDISKKALYLHHLIEVIFSACSQSRGTSKSKSYIYARFVNIGGQKYSGVA